MPKEEEKKAEKKPAFDIPDIREYFLDLEYVLGVIADGPTKSFAYRRLKYLSSKFTMYSLLNEFQELADMKVRFRLLLSNLLDMLLVICRKCHIGVSFAFHTFVVLVLNEMWQRLL